MLRPIRGSVGTCSCAANSSLVYLARCRRAQRLPALWQPAGARRHVRWQQTATIASAPPDGRPEHWHPPVQHARPDTLALPSDARSNEIGVQQLSKHIYDQVFPCGNRDPPSPELVELARDHLRRHDLLGKNNDTSAPVAFDLPPLVGDSGTLDEHFYRLGCDSAAPFLADAKRFALANLPPKPKKWIRQSGWMKYYVGDKPPEPVNAPPDNLLCFDTEVMWKEHPFAVMACAASPESWYAWLSPWLLGETENEKQLIPMGDPKQERTIVGHNIGYDRARILEEYDLQQTRNSFLDTMSLHVAVNGMCSQQRPTWLKHKKNRELRARIEQEGSKSPELLELLESSALSHEEEELWVERSSINSLRDVAKFHLGLTIDKEARNSFGELDREGILGNLDKLLTYCAADVAVTHRIYKVLLPNFLEVCPHPVSFAALRHLSNVILPVNKSWKSYIANAEATYQRLSDAVQERLVLLAEKALEIKDDAGKWSSDPWLRQLDWSGQEIKMTKGKKKSDPPRPAARQKKPGMPRWYKDLFAKNDSPINITVRTRIAPLLLRLSWEGHPLVWSDQHGWTFQVPKADMPNYTARQMTPCEFEEETVVGLRTDRENVYFKLPHKDGPTARCANPMAKGYLAFFEKGTLTSEYTYAKEALEMNASCSYWISARDRITSQLVVYEDDVAAAKAGPRTQPKDKEAEDESTVNGFIVPQVIPMGTVTRRAVENTWLTASNAKKNRVGSELKAMVRAPPGHVFVGADVDSEELWIASVVGDAQFKLHGGNAIGFMTLEGTKAAGTDLHSRTAAILGITRNDAKVFNYGRIYGAGLRFAAQLLRQFNPSLSEKETLEIATKLYATTKGTKTNRKALHKRPFWRGGTESFVFNKLEEFAEQDKPRTPVLGASITEALMGRFVRKGGYLTSRINWAIQSSGVDYLHLLIVAMDYLSRRYNIAARLAITVHDEIRYLVRDHDRYRAAMALQVANLWTRAMFAQQVGIDDLPQSCAFFSAVDIDTVLRKEVDMDCVTPSNPVPIPPGESIDMLGLLAKGAAVAGLDEDITPAQPTPRPERFAYAPRTPVMQQIRETDADAAADMRFLHAQISGDESELRQLLRETRRSTVVPAASTLEARFAKTKAAAAEMAATGGTKKPVVRPYYNRARLMPAEREPFSVTEALDAGRFRSSGGFAKARWAWERDHGRHGQWQGQSAKGWRPASRL